MYPPPPCVIGFYNNQARCKKREVDKLFQWQLQPPIVVFSDVFNDATKLYVIRIESKKSYQDGTFVG
jgi:hypothetical protein